MALTGTADDTTQSTICSELSLKANTCKLFISPNRPNIRISVNKVRKEGMESQLDWLVELTIQQFKKKTENDNFLQHSQGYSKCKFALA